MIRAAKAARIMDGSKLPFARERATLSRAEAKLSEGESGGGVERRTRETDP